MVPSIIIVLYIFLHSYVCFLIPCPNIGMSLYLFLVLFSFYPQRREAEGGASRAAPSWQGGRNTWLRGWKAGTGQWPGCRREALWAVCWRGALGDMGCEAEASCPPWPLDTGRPECRVRGAGGCEAGWLEASSGHAVWGPWPHPASTRGWIPGGRGDDRPRAGEAERASPKAHLS